MGFPVPFALWTQGAWHETVRDVLLDSRTLQRGLVDGAAVRAMLDAHLRGARESGDIVWSLLNLELWYRTYVDGEGVQQLGSADRSAARAAPSEDGASLVTTV
jgi:asparagine synthase (glutamine-hydrolysing)